MPELPDLTVYCEVIAQRVGGIGIAYAENECNYCARWHTGGTLLADRSLSRLLHKSWPKSIDELG